MTRLEQHVQHLGFTNLRVYWGWCRENGFSTSPGKPEASLQRESSFVNTHRATFELKRNNRPADFKTFIDRFRKNPSKDSRVVAPNKASVKVMEMADPKDPRFNAFLDMVLYLERNSKLLDPRFVDPLWHLSGWNDRWLKKPEDWEPQSHNADRQFSHFVRHLLAKYKVPRFMDSAWFPPYAIIDERRAPNPQIWFVHVGSGQNIRTAEGLPVPLTKMAAHHFLDAPDGSTIEEAFRWGIVTAMGGSERLLRAFRNTQLMNFNALSEPFVEAVIRFFIANPMMDMAQVGPIIDYIWNQKYHVRRVLGPEGVTDLPPAQPNFSMAGRTVETLLAQVERWHKELGHERKAGSRDWPHREDVHDFEMLEGKKEDTRMWKIEEILSSADLLKEGRDMHHCVGSYAQSCERGQTSIWAMSVETLAGRRKAVTIELNRRKVVCQVRGLRNRPADAKENEVIRQWCSKEGMSFNSRRGW